MLSGAALARIAMLPAIMGLTPWWNCSLRMRAHSDDDLLVPAHLARAETPGYRSNARGEITPREERHRRPAKDPALVVRDDLVVHALERMRPAFTRCYKRAQNDDPSLGQLKVQLRLYVDEYGLVLDAYSDVEDQRFANCLTNAARNMVFTAPGEMAMAYVALAW